jgi:hypothetical protein
MSNSNFLKIFVKKNIGSIIVRLSKKQIARISRNNQTCIFQICNKVENKCKTTGIKWKFLLASSSQLGFDPSKMPQL